MGFMTIELSEERRQLIILALAKLSLSRPGWHPACIGPFVDELGGRQMYEQFRLHGPDPLPQGKRFKFCFRADGKDHEEIIEAENFALACMKLGTLHGKLFGAGIPKDFRLDISSAEECP